MSTVRDKNKIIEVKPKKKTTICKHIKSKAEKKTELALKIIRSIYD